MLPFLKPKAKSSGIAMEYRKPDEPKEEDGMEGVEAAAEDLIKAMDARDKIALAKALKAAFEILDSLPHHEGDHLDEEDGNES